VGVPHWPLERHWTQVFLVVSQCVAPMPVHWVSLVHWTHVLLLQMRLAPQFVFVRQATQVPEVPQ